MKTVIVNASPRKNWNTAELLKEAKRGAEEAGFEVEYIDLYDLNFTGCRSCLACKRAGIEEPCKCYWKDDLSPVIESIYKADRLIVGAPIYFAEPTAGFRAFMERLTFPALSYNDYSSTFKGKVDTIAFFPMNVPLEGFKNMYEQRLNAYLEPMHMLNGSLKVVPVCDTLQVKDYSKFEMKGFSEEHKKEVREKEFPAFLEMAYNTGAGK